ncbi:MAG: PHP domain-containing protein [Candidatus Micrarchaeota archaeon]|nr:PHP domain-containing protein [Candidatus Micrarchaeota archaeon]
MKIELHIHTPASDGYFNPLPLLKRHARKHNLVLGISDHNTMRAIPLLKDILLIKGEEILALDGGRKVDVIGWFLEEEIPKGLEIGEVFDRIREQGGIVYAPHPLDFERFAMGEEWARKADVVEIFNAKTPPEINQRTQELFKDALKAVGTDAHFFNELGLTRIELPDFDLESPKEFLKALEKARFYTAYPHRSTKTIYRAIRVVKGWRKRFMSYIKRS